ncbi:MAG TPA: hypothetical protein VGI79_22150 [Caulobacteraceae bacterium]|jgi:hypothetical protein
MAARQSGGVGPFGWTLLGFLAGVAATLAVQLILVGRDREKSDQEEAHHTAPVVAVTPQLPAPKRKSKPVSDSVAAPKSEASEVQQVAEDAAAAGMTSRTKPSANATSADGPR